MQRDRQQQFIDWLKGSELFLREEGDEMALRCFPVDLYKQFFGKGLKSSCCFWPVGVDRLDEAEVESLDMVCKRAGLINGMRVLDFGCGFGGLSFWISENYPDCEIVSLPFSPVQRLYLEGEIEEYEYENIEIADVDIQDFDPEGCFDMIFSLEALSGMLNVDKIFSLFAQWLTPDGRLFLQSACHKNIAYNISSIGQNDWLAHYYMRGGIMPSDSLYLYFQKDLHIEQHWRISGLHYEKTADAWLKNIDWNSDKVNAVLRGFCGGESERFFNRWRMYFLTLSELFRSRGGNEWWVSQYLFKRG